MREVVLKINEIKNIKKGELSFPINKGIYCIVGANGSGKSTIMRALAQMVFPSSLQALNEKDFNSQSSISFEMNNKKTVWKYNNEDEKWITDVKPNDRIHFDGMYEGSLFYGTRFEESLSVDKLYKEGSIRQDDLVEVDQYVKEQLSYILHGDLRHYQQLKRIRNKNISKKLGLKNTPYFQTTKNGLISQYRMSSGECLLISLLHFIYNALIRRSLPDSKPILMLIDEIELALHPIAVSRLIDLINNILQEHENLVVYLSSHSPEVIRKINPGNIYMLEYDMEKGSIETINPCYPSYAIRDVYIHDGFDCVILVEDFLAKYIVDKHIKKLELNKSRLINILPVGGWENVLTLQKEILTHNTFGVGTKVVSILDGDVKELVTKSYKRYPKLFLPIKSIEKYLYNVLVIAPDKIIKKEINDMFFPVESIDELISCHYAGDTRNDRNGKNFYKKIIDNLERRNISEESFVAELSTIIMKNYDCSSFEKGLLETLS